MPEITERRIALAPSLGLLFLVAALVCYTIGLIVVHAGADFGKPLEWLFGGLICATLAKIL